MKKNRGEKSAVTTPADVPHLEAIRTELLDAAHALALAINLPTGHARRALVRRAWHAADIADASFTSPAEGVEIDAYEQVAHPTFQDLAPGSRQKQQLETELAQVEASWDEWAENEMRRTLPRPDRPIAHEAVAPSERLDEAERMHRAERAATVYSERAAKPDKTTDGGETLHLGGRS